MILLRKLSIIIAFLLFAGPLNAQDLEPRAISRMPIGANIVVASYGYSNGNILLDNSLQIEDLKASLNNFGVAYVRSFKLFNRLAKFDAVLPVSHAHFSGKVSDIDSSTNRFGIGDPSIRISILLAGTKPLGVTDFMNEELKKFKFGIWTRIRAPLGQYDPDKLLNLGTNRWGFKFGMGGSYTVKKKFIIEVHLNSWVFTENPNFFGGNTFKQKPVIASQLHLTYVVNKNWWLAVSLGISGLGETIQNGEAQDDAERESRFGAAVAYRINNHHSLKLAYTNGLFTRYGADLSSILVAYQFIWFKK